MAAQNIHASAVVVGDRGVLIAGGSGSGKSTLALALIDAFIAAGHFARLVGDDQVFVSNVNGRLVCAMAPAIAGLVEVYGLGPRGIASEPRAVIDLLVRLTPDAERFAPESTEIIAGCPVPCQNLAERNAVGAMAAVRSWLSMPPFAGKRPR